MKKLLSVLIFLQFISCNKKKLTEVVEVPLPSTEVKIEIGDPDDVTANEGTFRIQKLNYKYSSLEPNIDAITLENQYSKQYLNCTNNLNNIIAGTELENKSIEDIFKNLDMNNTDLRNNAGGYYNHSLYFDNLNTKSVVPQDAFLEAITKDFQDLENLKTQLTESANKQIGSGWAWLIVDETGKLQICTTPNQDNPLMPKQIIRGTPLVAIDLWEHAYFIKYLNQRTKYISAFFNCVDWKKVGEKYEEALKK